MSAEIIFVSMVTSEFSATREALRAGLSSRRRSVFAAEDDAHFRQALLAVAQDGPGFKKEGGTTIQMLFDFVSTSSLVIHIVGDQTGGPLNQNAVDHFHKHHADIAADIDKIVGSPDWSQISYTQLEAYFAHCLGKKLLVALAKGCPSGSTSQAQQAHLARLKAQNVYPDIKSFEDATDLENQIWQRHSGKRLFDQPERLPELSNMPKIYGGAVSASADLDGGSPRIFGRRDEQAHIDKAWHSPTTKVIGFIAGGGVGKSTLVIDWLANFHPSQRVSIFGFSFYLQGQTERQVDTDTFLGKIADYFGITVDAKAAPYAKGKFIAERLMRERALIVLDGMEPLQEASTGRFRSEDSKEERSSTGSFTDNGARGFIETLALAGDQFEGLCILTSRIKVSDLDYLLSGDRYVEIPLEGLEDSEGAAFLTHLGVKGTIPQKEAISHDLGGHALALLLTGTMIRDFHHGLIVDGTNAGLGAPNLAALGRMLPSSSERSHLTEGAKHTFKALDNYVTWFMRDGLLLELDVLHILGLFDRSAEFEAIDAVRRAPLIPGLTDHCVSPAIIGPALARLSRSGLIARTDEDKNGTVDFIDAHPLIRQYFGERLKNSNSGVAFREGHRRLGEHYSHSTADYPANAAQMALLYRTIGHCCLAGEMRTAFDDLLLRRAWRNLSPEARERNFATRHLGMISADFVALTQFFTGTLDAFEAHPDISNQSRFTLLTDIAVRMRSLGRLRTAKEALRKALDGFTMEKMQQGYDGAYAAAQLSELELISGELIRAEKTAERSVAYADLQPRTYLRFHARTSLADVLMQRGDLNGAGRLFAEAKQIADNDPQTDTPFFYSQTCYRYGLYLIETGHTDEFLALVDQTQDWGNQRPHKHKADGTIDKGSLLSSAIDQMILTEALVRRDEAALNYLESTRELIEGITGSLAQLNSSGYSDYLARGLNIAARFHTGRRDFDAAKKNLEQNREHVRRGKMRLLEADYLIEACRYHIARGDWNEAKGHHDDAVRLSDEIGYGRRKAELQRFALLIVQK